MRRRKATVLFVTTALLCAAMGALQAQVATTNPAKMAADADPDWEVVTVRPSDPNDKNKRFNVDGRHIVIEN